MIIIAMGLVWCISGTSGFIYWWRKDYDLTVYEIPVAVFGCIIGPLSWLIGYYIHGDSRPANGVLWKRRK